MDENNIRFGYACINMQLRDADVFTSRGLILKTAREKGIDYVRELIMDNIDDLYKIIIFNEAHGIRFYRISSCIFPHLDNPQLDYGDYEIDFAKDKLKTIGKYAKDHGHRLTFHVPPFVTINSPRPEVIAQSFKDLTNHAKIFKMLGYKPSDGAVMIIHGGGIFGNKEEALERWAINYHRLPKDVRDYIVLENDEFSYSVMDLLPFCEKYNIPLCLDIFHNRVSDDRVAITKPLLERIFNTWRIRGVIPKIHVSEQQPELRKGAHSQTLDRLPPYILKIPQMFDTPLDVMLEVKDKENSVFKMYFKYFDIFMDQNGRVYYKMKPKYQKMKLKKLKK